MTPAPRFAHASEAELARILDYYEVRWEYEPRTFPIRWNLDGTVVESFAPDFFLPELDLFIELTTLKQSLVRRKNRKLRRLRELYPMVRIKLLYAKDFRALLLKYGRIDVAASLIGLDGQLAPEANRPASDQLVAPVELIAAVQLVPADVLLPVEASAGESEGVPATGARPEGGRATRRAHRERRAPVQQRRPA